MAVRSNTDGVLSRSTNLPVNATGWTFCLWICSTNTEAAYRVPFLLGGTGGTYGALIVDTGTLNLSWQWNAAPGFFDTALLTLTDDAPVFVAVKCISATQIEVLWRAVGAGSLSTTGVLTIGAQTWTNMYALGDDAAGEEWSNGHAWALKLWHAALSTGEILAESYQSPPVRTSGIDSYLSLLDATDAGDDESGNGRDWTVSGTFATVGSHGAVAATLAGLTASASLRANKPIAIAGGLAGLVAALQMEAGEAEEGSSLEIAASLPGLVAAASLRASKPVSIEGGLAGLVASLQMYAGNPPAPAGARSRARDRQRGRAARWRG